jgi:ATP-binding cassette subfamily B protein
MFMVIRRRRADPGQGEQVIRRRITALFRPYRRRVMVIAALIATSALLGVVQPLLVREIVDTALPERDVSLLAMLVLGMVASAAVAGVIDVAEAWQSNIVGQRVMHGLRWQVYDRLQRQSLAFFTRTRGGDVQSRIANDIGGMQSVATSTATTLVSALTTVLATLVAMVVLDWRLALATLAVVPGFVWLTRAVGRQRRRITGERQRRLADMAAIVEESLSVSGIVLARTTGRVPDLVGRFKATSADVAQLEVRTAMSGRWRIATVQVAFAAMPALAYLLAGVMNSRGSGFISIGTLVAFTLLQTRLLMPMVTMLRLGVELQSTTVLFERVFAYLDAPIDVPEPARPVRLDAGHARGEVRLEHVSFGYDGVGAVLENIDLVVPAGGSVAIVGATGAGKTTLGYLIARLYDVTDGRVTIDGVDVRDLSSHDRSALIGVVAQETYLLHASVAENLRFPRPSATDEELVAAARTAQIHDVIEGLADGYDTVVGERGHRFSGGERQRLAIARTLVGDPPVLILDEATSALDAATERALQEAVDDLTRGRTTIAISHRLSTVQNACRIVVLDHGRLVEQGTHDELLALDGRYAALLAAGEADPPSARARDVGRRATVRRG